MNPNNNTRPPNNFSPPQNQYNSQNDMFGKMVPDHLEPSNYSPKNLAFQNRRLPRSSSTPSHKKLKYIPNRIKQVDSTVSFFMKHPFRLKNLNNKLAVESMVSLKPMDNPQAMDSRVFKPLNISNFDSRYNFSASNVLLRLFNNSTKQFLWENSIAIFGGRSSQNVPAEQQISKEIVLLNY